LEETIMKMQPTLILSGMAAGAIAAALVLSPNASAAPGAPSCGAASQVQAACQSPGNYQGTFAPQVQQPSEFQYPYGWLQNL
jgi:hypothetical protein